LNKTNIKLYEIFKTFSEADWDNLLLYIKSSDAISPRKYYPFVKYLKGFRNNLLKLKDNDISITFSKVYKKSYSEKTISNRLSELLQLLSDFFKKNAFKNNELIQADLYIDELQSRNLTNFLSKVFIEEKDIYEKYCYNDNSHKILFNILEKNSDNYALKGNSTDSIDTYYKATEVLFAEILSNLYKTGQEFLILKQHKLNQFSSMHNFIESFESDKLLEELEKLNKPIFTIPLIHYYVFKSLQNPDCKKYIIKAKKIYFANENLFTEKFKLHIYGKIMSYYYFKINNGDEKYFKDLFLLFKRKLGQNLVSDLTENYFFYINIFSEYVITGLKVKQYAWVKMVIEKYSPLLPEEIREDEYTLATVRLYSAKREYEKIINILAGSKIKNKKIYMDLIPYRLISCFELERYEECYHEIDNSRHFLKYNRERIVRVRTLPIKKFINRFSILLNYCMSPFNKDINSVFYELNKSGATKDDWTYSKFTEILGKKITKSHK
jgi:hypothetical protein